MTKRKRDARAGEFWNINNRQTRGHKGILTKRTNFSIEYIPTTHAEFYKRKRNIKLNENPQLDDIRDSFVVPKVFSGSINHLGKYHPEMQIKNTTDKSVVRNIKKQKRSDSRN